MTGEQVIIGVDPGRCKCGLAAVSRERVLHREICACEALCSRLRALLQERGGQKIVIGSGTNGRKLARALESQPDFPPIELVDEKYSTLEARKRFFRENLPRGLARLIPRSLRVPPVPIDDWVAVILAERALRATDALPE